MLLVLLYYFYINKFFFRAHMHVRLMPGGNADICYSGRGDYYLVTDNIAWRARSCLLLCKYIL